MLLMLMLLIGYPTAQCSGSLRNCWLSHGAHNSNAIDRISYSVMLWQSSLHALIVYFTGAECKLCTSRAGTGAECINCARALRGVLLQRESGGRSSACWPMHIRRAVHLETESAGQLFVQALTALSNDAPAPVSAILEVKTGKARF